jgi:hypothetical protein
MARDPLFSAQKKLALRVLTAADWKHWREKGYVIIRGAASAQQVEQAKAAIWSFCEMSPTDPSTWGAKKGPEVQYQLKELAGSGMVEIYHHQAMWDIRQNPRVYDAFVDIWDREDLWVNPNRANMLLPAREGEKKFDGFVHWDLDTSQDPLPFKVQGVLSLVDTSPEVGGTWGYPGLFLGFEEWVKTQPKNRDPMRPDPASVGDPVFLQMKAGDLLIFNSMLAHGVAPNRSADKVRMAMYIAMFPAREDDKELRDQRITTHLLRTAPKPVYPGDPRGWERAHYGPARLSELGERLLGISSWNEVISAEEERLAS